MTGPYEPTPEERAAMQASPWIPKSPAELCQAILDSFERELGSKTPTQVPELVHELKHKLEGAEYYLRKIGRAEGNDWWEAESFLCQARGTLEMLARIVHAILRNVPDSFDRDGMPIANALRNQPQLSRHYETSLGFADFIMDEKWIRELSAVRSATHHRYSLPSLAKAESGVVHLGGLTLEEFCIGKWLSLFKFSRKFMEWSLTTAVEVELND